MKVSAGMVVAGGALLVALAAAFYLQESTEQVTLTSVEPDWVTHFADDSSTFQALRPFEGLDPERVALGERLFHDPRLSRDNTIACASCHLIAQGGDDGRRVSLGVDGAPGVVNAPTVLNAALNFVQMWDGRADSLEAQVALPLHSRFEMDSNWQQVTSKLEQDAYYAEQFYLAYGSGVSNRTVAAALAEYQRSLITPGRFDRYLEGDETALSAQEREGFDLFQEYGCVACHQGRLVGGNLFQRMGVMDDYFTLRGGELTEADYGRYNVTGNDADRFAFKVPSLRNVALTAPYFHDGSVDSLEAAVRTMARVQLGIEMDDDDVDTLVAFLQALTGEELEKTAMTDLQAAAR